MKSTIRSVAAIVLSAVCASAVFAVTPTVADRNLDLLNAWFTPVTSVKTMPANPQASTTIAAQSTSGSRYKSISPARRDADIGM